MSGYLRLRQIALVAPDLERAVADIETVLGVRLCFRDVNVAKYGLVNALFPIGTDFLEIVTPTREGTTAGRFMTTTAGRGGYMAIFDCDDPERRREHAKTLGIRLAATLEHPGFWGTQLHPKDCRATMLEFDRSEGNETLMGGYHPAGPDWQGFVKTDVTRALRGIDQFTVHRAWGNQLRSGRWHQRKRDQRHLAGAFTQEKLNQASGLLTPGAKVVVRIGAICHKT